MKKYIHLFLCFLVLTTGCAKKQQNTTTIKSNKKTHKTKKATQETTFDKNLENFALDDEMLHDFAHDTTPTQTVPKSSRVEAEPMFAWQNAAVDESKEDFKRIYFEFDKYSITDDQKPALKADIDHAQKMINAGKVIVIEGHACDSAGAAIYNMTLSEKRAKFIANEFAKAGIDKANIKIAARGQEFPVVKGGNRHQQAVNRRVEVYAIDSK